MAVTEQSRHQLFKKLEEVLGMEEAGTLFELVPPMGWGDFATKQDIDALRVATKQDIDALRVDIDALRVATKQDIDALRLGTEHGMHLLRLDLEHSRTVTQHGLDSLKSDLKDELATKLRGLFFAIAAAFLGVLGLLLAAANWL